MNEMLMKMQMWSRFLCTFKKNVCCKWTGGHDKIGKLSVIFSSGFITIDQYQLCNSRVAAMWFVRKNRYIKMTKCRRNISPSSGGVWIQTENNNVAFCGNPCFTCMCQLWSAPTPRHCPWTWCRPVSWKMVSGQ